MNFFNYSAFSDNICWHNFSTLSTLIFCHNFFFLFLSFLTFYLKLSISLAPPFIISSCAVLETGLKPVLFFLYQEWSHPDPIFFTHCTNMKYTIKVSFRADIFGTFRQSVIFSFGFEPHLRQDLCVDVVPVLDEEETKIQQLQETLIKQAERYSTVTTRIPDTQLPETGKSYTKGRIR